MSKGKKSKPKVIKRIPKNVKQHVVRVSDEKELLFIAEQYKNVKNYVYARYSGVNSLPMLKDYKKKIRDIWVKDGFAEQWKLPARYELLNKETERLNKVNARRNPYYALMRKYEAEGNLVKANTIRANNLGKKKYNKQKNKHDATVKSYINDSLNQFIFSEKPSDMIQEDLSFVSWNDKFPKHVKRKLSRWIKGYIKERLEYKAELYKIKIHKVNAAYTSQICHKCGCFGHRNVDVFTCTKCGEMHADINASHNIKERKNDKEITLYTNYKTVKQILENRITAKVS